MVLWRKSRDQRTQFNDTHFLESRTQGQRWYALIEEYHSFQCMRQPEFYSHLWTVMPLDDHGMEDGTIILRIKRR